VVVKYSIDSSVSLTTRQIKAELVAVIGSGMRGTTDGGFDQARFNRPQGLCWDGERNVLYVADTENHLIREVDFDRQVVRTILGTGIQGHDHSGGKQGTEQCISSPWDLVRKGDALYIAMAGTHQIWKYNLSDGIASNFCGSGNTERQVKILFSYSYSFFEISFL
jgi:hypothetical protein